MSAQNPDNIITHGKLTRALIYTALIIFAFYYLLPLYVMLVNSLKPLEEIRQGGMRARGTDISLEVLAQEGVDRGALLERLDAGALQQQVIDGDGQVRHPSLPCYTGPV